MMCSITYSQDLDDSIVTWKRFPHCWPLMRGTHRSQVDCSEKGYQYVASNGCFLFWLHEQAFELQVELSVIWDAVTSMGCQSNVQRSLYVGDIKTDSCESVIDSRQCNLGQSNVKSPYYEWSKVKWYGKIGLFHITKNQPRAVCFA